MSRKVLVLLISKNAVWIIGNLAYKLSHASLMSLRVYFTSTYRTCRKGGAVLDSKSHGKLLYRYLLSSVETATGGADLGSDSEDDVGIGEDTDPAAAAAAAVAAAVAAGDAVSYAAALAEQKKLEAFSV